MNNNERAQFIITDILNNHLPRIKEGLERGYVDENQILVMYDHAVRARILRETEADAIDPGEIRNEQDERWLNEIAMHNVAMTGKAWDTRDDIASNIAAFVKTILDNAKAER